MAVKVPRLLVAGTHSGVGKTTVTIGLALAFRRFGWTVQPFKVGPDYIDPGYLSRVTGRLCRNLDTWLMPKARLPESVARAAAGTSGALIEGVMGLYDGWGATQEEGSTAQVAKGLRCPVLLVLDVSAVSRSAAALVIGFKQMDPDVRIAGCVLNRVGSPSHYQLVKEGIERLTGVPVVGWLPRDARFQLPERHLGLVPWQEQGFARTMWGPLEKQMNAGFDLPAIARMMRQAPPLVVPPARPAAQGRSAHPKRSRVPIGLARDEAFHFYYPENLELLEERGAELVPFSPLKNGSLPRGLRGLYLGGGFPEIYASALSNNQPIRRQIRQAITAGMPTYAECGGLMYLARALRDARGRRHPMVGSIPLEVRMTDRLQNFGYKKLRARKDNLLARQGEEARGHEFHHSVLNGSPARSTAAYEVVSATGSPGGLEGYRTQNLVASYVHVHFWSQPRWAGRFVQAAREKGA